MLFWIITAALAALIALLLGLALWRGRSGAEPSAAYDLRVYRDQLRDVERDLARGVLAQDEAERLRLEISRRVLEADRAVQAGHAAARAPRGVTLTVALGAAVVLGGSFWLYQRLGAPGYPDLPLALRIDMAQELYDNRPTQDAAEETAAAARGPLPEPDPQFTTLMERLRAVVAQRPNDLEGLALLARNEANMGNYRAAWEAQRRLVALKADAASAEDHAQLAELMVVAAGGVVTAEAEGALGRALALDPRNGLARYYVGLMMAQNGRGDRAFRIWDGLLRESTADAPWVPQIMANIPALAWLAGEADYTPPTPRAGAALDLAGALQLPPEDREAALRPGLEALNARLAQQGGTAQDWAQLLAALRLLGEDARADAVLGEAETLFAQRPEDLALIRAANAGTPPGPAQPALPGPGAAEMEAAGAMSETERQEMIQGMVAGLEDRLLAEGGSAGEWARLISSLGILGETARARAAVDAASAALSADPAALEQIRAAARAAGVDE